MRHQKEDIQRKTLKEGIKTDTLKGDTKMRH